MAYVTKTAYKILNAEKICKTKRSEWDGEEDKNYNRIQTARRGWVQNILPCHPLVKVIVAIILLQSVRARPGGNPSQTTYQPNADSHGVDIRVLLAAAQRDHCHVRVPEPSLRVALLPADVLKRTRRRHELHRLQPVPVRGSVSHVIPSVKDVDLLIVQPLNLRCVLEKK